MKTSALLPIVFTAAQLAAQIFAPGAKLEKLYEGGHLTEGVTAAPDGTMYFSDITFTTEANMQAGHILRFDPRTRKTTVFRSPSGMSNGLKFDAQGRLIAAEGADYGGRRITRTDMATGKATILAGRFNGRPFNSPNDVAIDERGRIYFSDPRYLGWEPIEQPVMAVYRLDPDGTVHRIITDAGKPNGVAISPDQRSLYVVTNDDGHMGFDVMPKGTPARKGRMELNAYDLAPTAPQRSANNSSTTPRRTAPTASSATPKATSSSPSVTRSAMASMSILPPARNSPTCPRPNAPPTSASAAAPKPRPSTSPPAAASTASRP